MPAKKTSTTSKPAKKPVKPPAPAKAAAVKKAPAATKVTKAKPRKVVDKKPSPVFLEKSEYKACIDGLMGQGLEHSDAVETLRVGLRQANGRPLPPDLAANMPGPAPAMAA